MKTCDSKMVYHQNGSKCLDKLQKGIHLGISSTTWIELKDADAVHSEFSNGLDSNQTSIMNHSPYFANSPQRNAKKDQQPCNDGNRMKCRKSVISPKKCRLTNYLYLKNSSSRRVKDTFFNKSVHELSQALLGCVLVSQTSDGCRVSGFIVETEAYPGGCDAASHSAGGKRTPRNEPMYMPAGTAYVYIIYGFPTCMNISSSG